MEKITISKEQYNYFLGLESKNIELLNKITELILDQAQLLKLYPPEPEPEIKYYEKNR
jgi:hypothetical protein